MSRRHAGAETLGVLFRETVSLYLRLSADASAIHGFGALSGPRRTLLLALASSGPQTVARLARARAQSRQRLQPLINALIEAGLLKAMPNPMHKQSPLMVLTGKGERQARDIAAIERALLARLRTGTSPRQLAEAAAVLRQVRQALESQLPELLNESRRRKRRNGP